MLKLIFIIFIFLIKAYIINISFIQYKVMEEFLECQIYFLPNSSLKLEKLDDKPF